MKKTRFLLPFVFPALLAAPMSLANEVMTLSQRVAPDFAQQASRNADNKGQTLSGLATQYRDALLADGSWPDAFWAGNAVSRCLVGRRKLARHRLYDRGDG
ncbi:hypothetical protein [Vibrio vulnificus]|uniref:hypothetical protein n=1 Tax=Vibrio vulnificus TaxID=672 RepID=UPI001F2517C0